MTSDDSIIAMSMDATLRLGLDLGGTKIEGVVVRAPLPEREAPPEVLARVRVPTERDLGYDHVADAAAGVISEVARQAGLSTLPPVGMGMPGSVTAAGLVKNSNTTCLNGRPFRQDLVARVGVPIAFANDANCFALSEAVYGAARRARVTFGVILGTGVGGGIVLRDANGVARPWDGAQGIAGEWGHVTLDPIAGPSCYCGRRGCIEQYLSGPALEARGDRGGTYEGAADIFGRALATVINILDPDVVVLGGGVSNLDFFYSEGIEAVARWIFNDELRTKIVKHSLGDSAGVLGAALLPPA